MDIRIEKGSITYLNDCEEALLHSSLGKYYFAKEGSAKSQIIEGIEKDTLYVALENDTCVGFFYIIPKGAFHSFPYLHIIAIKEEYRGKGLGRIILQKFEELAFSMANKIFLVVASFNMEAKHFYEKNGYIQVGEIPSLYRPNITEYLMMKKVE